MLYFSQKITVGTTGKEREYPVNATIYASDYAKLDSNVYTGGGTDQTEILQGLLDRALEFGRIRLVMDGAALVRGLKVHSNTTIECMDKSCGFFLADDSDCAVLCNADPTYGEIKNRNITLIGGTYNHNCMHQAHDVPCDDPALTSDAPDNQGARHWTVALEFIGVENLNVRDLTVRDQRTFAFTVGNFRHVNVENTYIELVNEIPFGNQDGFHFWGHGQFLTMRNIGGKTEDDFMNIGPDERDGVSAITDVLIDGVFLDHAWQGVRLLSRDKGRLDRVTIRNVTGTYSCYGFYVNPWFPDSDTMGNFGSITFENIDLRPEDANWGLGPEQKTANPPFLFCIGGDHESLTLRNIKWHYPDCDWTVFRLGFAYAYPFMPYPHPPRIRSLLIDGVQIMEGENAKDPNYMLLRGRIDRLTLRDIQIFRAPDAPGGCLLSTLEDADIGRLTLENVDVQNLCCLLDLSGGRTQTVVLRNVTEENVACLIRGGESARIAEDGHIRL